MVRFVHPDTEVRIAGGREVHLRSMQPLGLHIANSIFLGDYLTSEGQAGQADLDMIKDAGFEVEGQGEATMPRHRAEYAEQFGGGCGSAGACGSSSEEAADAHACGGHAGGGCGPCGEPAEATAQAAQAAQTAPEAAGQAAPDADELRSDLVRVRRRGAGTELAPNA
jgi:biotin synthase